MPKTYGACGDSRKGFLAWSEVSRRLARAHNYWVGTTRPGGRPHAMPVWGLWLDEAFYFSTDRGSRKGRNLTANPALVVHLESGDDVVILEGVAREVTDRSELKRMDDAYHAKYGMRVLGMPGDVGFYSLRPRVALAWRERDFPSSATRWVFAPKLSSVTG